MRIDKFKGNLAYVVDCYMIDMFDKVIDFFDWNFNIINFGYYIYNEYKLDRILFKI